jgi:exosortase/archaeosortase
MLVTKRHDFWRLFDIMWMLHIMDYDTREDIHNPLLTIMASLALLTALAGLALVYISFRSNQITPENRPNKKVTS